MLTHALADHGFKVSQADPGVFYARVEGHTLILAVHVDDCVLTGSSAELIKQYKSKLNNHFSFTDLGPLHWLLGIKVTHNREARTISLSQTTYINSLLRCFNLTNVRPYYLPMMPSVTLSRHDAPSNAAEEAHMHHIPYCEATSAKCQMS